MAVLTDADWDDYVNYFSREGRLIMVEGTVVGRQAIKEKMENASARMAAAAEGRPIRRRVD